MAATGYGDLVLLDKKAEGYAILTLNRPAQRNAMNRAAQAEMQAALDDARDCKVLIITGNGPAFCAGIDLKESREIRSQGTEREFAHGSNGWVETNEALRKHPAVCIAAVNGFALGGGLTLAHNCELAIASEQAQFGMPEFGFGTFPGQAGPATIRRILPKHAAYMILTSRRIDPHTAERWGIVNAVVPHDQLLPEAEELARHICQFDAVLIDFAKKAIRDLDLMPWDDGLVYGGYIGNMVRQQSSASREGLDRFASGEKNPGQGAEEPVSRRDESS